MELGLKEKVIIVTGGGSGIGASVVDNLSLIGATPVIIDKSKPDDTFYKIIKKRCPRAIWKTLALCDDQDSKKAVKDILTKLSKIDGLVNNAGINVPRLLVDPAGKEELTEDVWDKVFAVNVKGQFLCAQAAARAMLKQEEGGVLINMSSESGLEGSEGADLENSDDENDDDLDDLL